MAAAENDFQGRLNELLSAHQATGNGFGQLLTDYNTAARNGAVQIQQQATERIEAANKANAAAMAALRAAHAKLQADYQALQAQHADATARLAAIESTPEWKARRAAQLDAEIAKATAAAASAEALKKQREALGVK